MKKIESLQAKPFLKWAGGKTRLIDEIHNILPQDLSNLKSLTYVEPFVGGGAVLFWILQKYPNITTAVINDINEQLICTYRVIKDDVENLIDELQRLQDAYLPLDDNERKAFYIAQRDRYNNSDNSDIETAALFIFLNRTCFNGLYRVNSKGKFNVPHGRYKTPRICDEATLRADSQLLTKVTILCGDFEQTETYADQNSLFYFDPPYRPLNETSAFTSYSKDGFNDSEQTRLRDFCQRISTKESLFIESNSDPRNEKNDDDFFDALYGNFTIRRVSAPRAINSKADKRGAVSEIIVTNIVNH